MASYWRWSCVVEADGRQHVQQGDMQGPDHATEDKIQHGVENGLRQLYPRGYKLKKFMATRIG